MHACAKSLSLISDLDGHEMMLFIHRSVFDMRLPVGSNGKQTIQDP